MDLTGIRQKVFLDRYSLKDAAGKPVEKTPSEMWRRVANGIARLESPKMRKVWEDKFYNAMEGFKYVPGGRILAGAGTGYKITYYNCFVIPSPKDSRDGILETLKQMVEIMARGGGVGINLSSLRPRGARVKKVNGFSSGPCNWAELFSVATRDIIQQGGTRRGALMLMLWDWHPDIEEFITVKTDLARINGANLSVCVSDEFMEAVKRDADWDLVFPDTTDPEYDKVWNGYLHEWKAQKRKINVFKTIKARKLWDLICEAAWRSAEPGVVFMERYNKWNNNWYWNYINCVNPCVTGETLVATEHGWAQAKDLTVGTKILTPKGFKPIDKVYNNGKQRIYKVTFSDGGHLRATGDHKLRVITNKGNQEWVKVIDLAKGDQVLTLASLGAADERRERDEDKRNEHKQHNNHQQQISIEGSDIRNHMHYNFAFLAQSKLSNQNIPEIAPQNITLSQSTLSTPVSTGGTTARANTTWPIPSVMSDNFLSSERVKRSVSTSENRDDKLIASSITQIEPQANTAQVVQVEDTGIFEDVFDVHEPETLTWVTNGYVSLDCGEEGLPAWGVCNLGSINLSEFVLPGKTPDEPGTMDFAALGQYAKIGVRFQDNVIDGDVYFFDGIRQTQLNGERRIGLGTMGLGDALIKMHLRYGSDQSLPVIDKIYKTIRDAAYEASIEGARDKGVFPKFNASKYLKGLFIKELPKHIRDGIKKYGIRNSILLMQAPTGSTSLMSGTTSGIEPVYEFEFLRRDRLGQHILRHHLYDAWFENYKKMHDGVEPKKEDRPDYFVAANDLTPEDHIKVQAVIQKYVDASISKTVNAPKTHTVEDVKKLYTMAYDLGCKGVAYMREGSRQGVLERIEKPATTETPVAVEGKMVPQVKPRPMKVDGSTYQIETPVGRAYVTVNTNGNKQPLEVFVNVGKAGSDVSAMAEGIGRLISLILRIASPLSALERSQQIVKELAGIGGSRHLGFGDNRVRSLPDAISKVLSTHFGFRAKGNGITHTESNGDNPPAPIGSGPADGKTEEKVVEEQPALPVIAEHVSTADFDLCPECGVMSLAYEEGCKKCYSCGYSEC